MWISEWTRCPRCGRDCALRLMTMAAEQRSGSSLRSMLLPARPLKLEGSSWECDCGARLRFARRRYRAADFLAAGVIAVVWTAAGFLTGFAVAYPRIYWFAGIVLVVIALLLHGVGKHEVQLAEEPGAG